MSVIHAPIRINVNIARGKKSPSNSLKCSEIRGTYKMFYQQSFSHNLVSFRRAYQCYCQPCKKGTFLFKKGTFLITLKVGGACAPSAPPSYTPAQWCRKGQAKRAYFCPMVIKIIHVKSFNVAARFQQILVSKLVMNIQALEIQHFTEEAYPQPPEVVAVSLNACPSWTPGLVVVPESVVYFSV